MARALILGLSGAAALLLGLELALRALPVSTATMTGYHHDPLIVTYPSGHRWTVATGWDLRNPQRLQANNMGFASSIDFVRDERAVGLIGDSFVEASMLDDPDRPAPQLGDALGRQRRVYAFGGPGSALLDYAERIRLASQALGVRDFVVLLEPGDVRQSLCGSGNIHGPCLDRHTLQPRVELQPAPSPAKQLFRHSALAQYLFGQLRVDAARLLRQALPGGAAAAASGAPPETPQSAAARDTMVREVTDAFFARIAPFATGRLVLIVNGRRERLGGAATAPPPDALALERRAFIELARQRGATVVDAEPLFQQHWAASSLALEVGPYDKHLNRLGVGVLMRAAAQALP